MHTAQHIIGAHVPVCETLAVGASKWRDFDRDFPAPESYAALKLQVKLLRTNLDSGSYPPHNGSQQRDWCSVCRVDGSLA